MSLENTGDKERREQIGTLKSRKEVLLLKQRRKQVLARRRMLINQSEAQKVLKKEEKPTIYILYER